MKGMSHTTTSQQEVVFQMTEYVDQGCQIQKKQETYYICCCLFFCRSLHTLLSMKVHISNIVYISTLQYHIAAIYAGKVTNVTICIPVAGIFLSEKFDFT